MYPVVRALVALGRASFEPRISLDDSVTITTVCWPWDADMFLELNNGRHLTLFDNGRLVHFTRLGFLPVLRREGWGVVVGGAAVQYRRRIRLFERFDIVTRCLARDERWLYFDQTTVRKGAPCSQAILRVAVLEGASGIVPTQKVVDALGFPDWRGALPPWARLLWDAEDRRPWPPERFVAPDAGAQALSSASL